MPKVIQKEAIKVKLYIQPGPVGPTMKMSWRVLWARLIASAREELDKEEKSKHGT